MKNPEAEWFGFEPVAANEKAQRVGQVFSSVAKNYDRMNDLMSFGLHRGWKAELLKAMRPMPGQKLLDVAAGTGDIARGWLAAAGDGATALLLDASEDMLAEAVRRGLPKSASCLVADAASLPIACAQFDTLSISFGLRNVARIDDALQEFVRVLKPGGRFFCLEFTPVELPLLRKIYDAYSFAILPRLGKLVAGDAAAYQYLAESIRQFPAPDELAQRMEKAGFACVRFRRLLPGVCVLHQAVRV